MLPYAFMGGRVCSLGISCVGGSLGYSHNMCICICMYIYIYIYIYLERERETLSTTTTTTTITIITNNNNNNNHNNNCNKLFDAGGAAAGCRLPPRVPPAVGSRGRAARPRLPGVDGVSKYSIWYSMCYQFMTTYI